MFDIGFSEVLLIFVIALVVLGPEKLPRAASQVGRWIGRARAMARQFKEQLEEEVNLENVRKAHKETAAKEAAAGGTASSAETGASAASMASGASAETSSAASGADVGSAAESTTGAGTTTTSAEPGASTPIESTAPTTIPPEAYTGPDPTEFRADTFSHAHPTNEYGANPLTANGAPEEMKPHPVTEASVAAPSEDEPAREPLATTATQSDNHGHS
jgi:sec-independent protein translocase protein TatB